MPPRTKPQTRFPLVIEQTRSIIHKSNLRFVKRKVSGGVRIWYLCFPYATSYFCMPVFVIFLSVYAIPTKMLHALSEVIDVD